MSKGEAYVWKNKYEDLKQEYDILRALYADQQRVIEAYARNWSKKEEVQTTIR